MKTLKFIFVLIIFTIPSLALALPHGSYRRTCRRCSFHNGSWLSCSCKDRFGFYRFTTLVVQNRCVSIANINGHLKCVRYRHHHHHRYVSKFEVKVGPIWNEHEAKRKCPRACHHRGANWTGQWNTIVFGRQSVCECKRPHSQIIIA